MSSSNGSLPSSRVNTSPREFTNEANKLPADWHKQTVLRCTPFTITLLVIGMMVSIVVNTLLTYHLTKTSVEDFLSNHEFDKASRMYNVPSTAELLLPTKSKPLHYDLMIKTYLPHYIPFPHEKNLTFDGKVMITIKVIEPMQEIVLNKKNITLIKSEHHLITNDDKVEIEKVIEHDALEKVTFVLSRVLQANEEIKLEISFIGKISKTLGGIYQTTYREADGKEKIAAITQFEPTDARRMVPCFDEPKYKATWTVTIIHPKGTKAISNGIEIDEKKDIYGWLTTRFKTTPLMSSYLLAIFVSEFDYNEKLTRGGVRFRVWSRPEAKMTTQFALTAGIKCLEFYERYFGIKYPLKKQDMVAIPDFSAGAMENWGLITFRENLLLYNTRLYDLSSKRQVAMVVAHELAHQWLGNLVTMQWWDDIWLNEGFATMAEYLGADKITNGYMRMKDYFLLHGLSKALNADSFASSHPLSHKLRKASEIDEVFDSISYSKGASILFMLSALFGEEKFKKGVTHYLEKFSYNNAKADDLWDSFDEVITDVEGPDGNPLRIKEFADQWTTQMGYPILTVEYLNSTTFKITQQRYTRNRRAREAERFRNPSYGFEWDVPVWYQVANEEVKQVWLKRYEPLYIHLSSPNRMNTYDTSIVINAERYGFYRQNYDIKGWTVIIDRLKNNHKIYSLRTRNAIISDIFAAAEMDLVPYEKVFHLMGYLKNEEEYLPWAEALKSIRKILKKFGNEPESMLIKKYMMDLLKKFYERIELHEIADDYIVGNQFSRINRDLLIMKTYCALGSSDCKKKFKMLFDEEVMTKCQKGDLASECVSIAAPLRADAYCYGVKLGDDTAFQKVMDLYKAERVQIERNHLLNALGCHKDVTSLKLLLRLGLDWRTSVIRLQDVAAVFRTVSRNPIGREFIFNYLLENWDNIYESLSISHNTIGGVIAFCTKGIRSSQQIEQLKLLQQNGFHAFKFGAFNKRIEKAEENVKWIKKHFRRLAEFFAHATTDG